MSETNTIAIEYTIERKEYVLSFLIASYKLPMMKVLIPLAILSLGLSFYHLPELRLGEYFPSSLTITFGVTIIFICPLLLIWLGVKKYNFHSKAFEHRKLMMNSETIIILGQTFETIIATDTIHSIQLHHRVYYLTGNEKNPIIIPMRALSEEDKKTMADLFKNIE